MMLALTFLALALLAAAVFVHDVVTWEDLPPADLSVADAIPPVEQLLLWNSCHAGGRAAITAHLILRAQRLSARASSEMPLAILVTDPADMATAATGVRK